MKEHANKGVKRNKKPLKNIVYYIELISELDLKANQDISSFEKFKFKDKYLVLNWKYQTSKTFNLHGFITPDEIKELLGDKQYSKFCQGKMEFIMQRRINKKNI